MICRTFSIIKLNRRKVHHFDEEYRVLSNITDYINMRVSRTSFISKSHADVFFRLANTLLIAFCLTVTKAVVWNILGKYISLSSCLMLNHAFRAHEHLSIQSVC